MQKMNNYPDNNSLFAFNPADYIDLDTASAEEELSSLAHSTRNDIDNYRFSLKSMNDEDLNTFRRSLITPMSLNSKNQQQQQQQQDPMYTAAPISNMRKYKTSSPINNISPPRAYYYSKKRQDTPTSPTDSCGESVTESIALFQNNNLNGDCIDLIKSDLRDFMSPYDMEDLMSRPGSNSRLSANTPPMNTNRYNRDSLVSRHCNTNTNNQMPLRYTNTERGTNINDNLLTTTNMDTNDKVTQLILKPCTNNTSIPRSRKSSVDKSVQTSVTANTSLSRRVSSPAIQLNTTQDNISPPPRKTTSKERVQKLLLKLSQKQQIQSVEDNISRAAKSDDKRRWSSYIPSHLDDIPVQKEDSNRSSLTGSTNQNDNTSRYAQKSSITNALLPTNKYGREKRTSVDISTTKHAQQQQLSYSATGKQLERRASQRNSLMYDQNTKVPVTAIRRSVLIGQKEIELKASATKEEETTQQYRSSRDMERRSSTRAMPPQNSEYMQRKKVSVATASRRASHGALSITNKNSESGSSNKQYTQQETPCDHNNKSSSRNIERHSAHRKNALSNLTAHSKQRDLNPFSTRRVERESSSQDHSYLLASSASHLKPLSTTNPRTKRYSYNGGGLGKPPKTESRSSLEASQQQSMKTEQQHRVRALSMPASSSQSKEQASSTKPSLMPISVSRFRKHSNNSLSRYEIVPEESEVAPPAKEVRFSSVDNEESTSSKYLPQQNPDDILPVASSSTGGYSNSTASSSFSVGDIDYDPPTPPNSYIDHRHDKRRSVVAPPSFKDPMYTTNTLPNVRTYERNSPINDTSPTRVYYYSKKSQDTPSSPTDSCGESVTESVTLFQNNNLDGDCIDLIKSDLRDFMSPYDMEDLMSRPGSNSRSPPNTPTNTSRCNRDSLISRHYADKNNQVPSKYTNIERDTNINMDTNDKITQSISKLCTNNTNILRERKSSTDLLPRRVSSPAIQQLNTTHDNISVPRRRTTSREHVQKLLLKLSQKQQIQSVEDNISRAAKSDDKRRWSSYIPSHLDDIPVQKEDSNRSSLTGSTNQNDNTSRYAQKSSITNALLPTNKYGREKRTSVDISTTKHAQQQQLSYSATGKQLERRASQRNSLMYDRNTKAPVYNL